MSYRDVNVDIEMNFTFCIVQFDHLCINFTCKLNNLFFNVQPTLRNKIKLDLLLGRSQTGQAFFDPAGHEQVKGIENLIYCIV